MTDVLQSNPFQCLNFKEIQKIPKHVIRGKIAYARQRFQDLDLFMKQIEGAKAGVVNQPYTYNKRNIFWYRVIFIAFALLFFTLALTSMSLTTTIGCGIFFSSCNLLKSSVFCVCVLLTFCSFLMAFSLSAERDAAIQCSKKAKAILSTIYKRKKSRLGLGRWALFTSQRQQAITLKHLYDDAYDRIHDKREATLHLLHRISTTPSLQKEERETLLNQAIEELNDKLIALNHEFRHAKT